MVHQKTLRLWAEGQDFSDILRFGRNSVESIAALATSGAAVHVAQWGSCSHSQLFGLERSGNRPKPNEMSKVA